MHNDYMNYLKGTTVYSSLESSEKKLKELKESVDELVRLLSTSDGETIKKMKTDVNNAKPFITATMSSLKNTREKLEYNAKRFDTMLSNLISKKAESGVTKTTSGSGLFGGFYDVYSKMVYEIVSTCRDSSDGNIKATITGKKYVSDRIPGPPWVFKGQIPLSQKFDVNGNAIGSMRGN